MAYTKPNIGTLTSLAQVNGNIKPNSGSISNAVPKFDISLTPAQVSNNIRKDISFKKNIQDQANVIKSIFK
jgi:hypothetical protein